MKKLILILLALILMPACAWWDGLSGGGTSGGTAGNKTPRQQLSEAKTAFDKKIENAAGQSLRQVRSEWGSLEKGLAQSDLTVYKWSQTAQLIPPSGQSMPVSSPTGKQQTTSCLAMFIVNSDNIVVDATSEGQCFDYRYMPAWKPTILESTDGKTGPVHR